MNHERERIGSIDETGEYKNEDILFLFENNGGDGKGGLCCEFPYLPGCMTHGDNLVDLMKNAADELENWQDATIERAKSMPKAYDVKMLKAKVASCEEPPLFLVHVERLSA